MADCLRDEFTEMVKKLLIARVILGLTFEMLEADLEFQRSLGLREFSTHSLLDFL